MKRLVFKTVWIVWVLIMAFCWSGSGFADESTMNDEWQFGGELYFWGASIDGETATGSGIEADFDDILDSLEMAFMGVAGIRKGRWSLLTDVIYLNVEDSGDIAPGVDASVELTNWVVTPFVAYNVLDTQKGSLSILGGARYLYLKTELSIGPFSGDDSGSTWDGIVGTRGDLNLSQNWYLFGYLDIGAGDSDLTWQGIGGLGYRFKWFDLVAAYRYLSWDFDDDALIGDLEIHGPALGIKMPF